jgi:hypothetical protein
MAEVQPTQRKTKKPSDKGIARAKREQKKKEAEERQQARAARTPEQQIARLDKMFGKGKGAERERARLLGQR